MPVFHRRNRGTASARPGLDDTEHRGALRLLCACLVALAASVCIAACGSSSPSKSADGIPDKAEAQADAVKFAKCMREHGIKAEASTNGGGIQIKLAAGGGHAGGSEAEGKPSLPPGLEAAQNACKRYMPNEGKPIKLSPAEEAKEREDALKFARCMRSHGVDVPDPGPGGVLELGSNINPNTATYEDAQKACQGLMSKVPLRVTARAPAGGRTGSESTRVGG